MRIKNTLWTVLGLMFLLTGCGEKEKNSAVVPEMAAQGVLRIHSVMELQLSGAEQGHAEMVAYLQESGWMQSERGFERDEEPVGFSVFSGGIEQPVTTEGTFVVNNVSQIELRYNGGKILSTLPLEKKMVGNEVHLLVSMSVRDHFERHGQHDDHGHEHLQGIGGHLPCLDYNGPWGNQRNNAGGYQEYINFIASDCQVAWPVCSWADHTPWPYCNGSRNCSSLIGHCSGYHRHTYPAGPSC